MYKTVWKISGADDVGPFKTELTVYHFGKNPCFLEWYMTKDTVYIIEMMENIKLMNRPNIFWKCLTHYYIIK